MSPPGRNRGGTKTKTATRSIFLKQMGEQVQNSAALYRGEYGYETENTQYFNDHYSEPNV